MISVLDLNHTDARRMMEAGGPVYLCVNPVEYHGPHLSLRNDALVTAGLVRDLHARLQARHPDWQAMVVTDLEVGSEPAAGIGSRLLPFGIVRRLVLEACRGLVDLGCKRVVLMTFHGAPLHNLALWDGVRLLQRHGVRAVAPFNVVLAEMLRLDPAPFAAAFASVPEGERDAMMAELQHDFHAGFFETSVALHYAPQSVSPHHRTLPSCPPVSPSPAMRRAAAAARALGRAALADELEFAAVGVGWASLRPFPGYTGRPQHASAEAGAVFAKAIIARYEACVKDVLADRAAPPPPIMPWVRRATLGGLLGRTPRLKPRHMKSFIFPESKAKGAKPRAAQPEEEPARV